MRLSRKRILLFTVILLFLIVVDRIIEEQKIEVDAVSGATNSSIVIAKAVENALKLKMMIMQSNQ